MSQLDLFNSVNSYLISSIDKNLEAELSKKTAGWRKEEKEEFKIFRQLINNLSKKNGLETFDFKTGRLQKMEIEKDLIPLIINPPRYQQFIRKMTLVNLVSDFETFLRDVLRYCYGTNLKSLLSSEKKVAIKEIVNKKNIEELSAYLINRELEKVFRCDIDSINAYLKQKFNVDLSKIKNWKKFREIFYRRNIIVHNNRRINKTYIEKTNYKGKKKYVEVSEIYLTNSINTFKQIGKIISEKLEEKFFKN